MNKNVTFRNIENTRRSGIKDWNRLSRQQIKDWIHIFDQDQLVLFGNRANIELREYQIRCIEQLKTNKLLIQWHSRQCGNLLITGLYLIHRAILGYTINIVCSKKLYSNEIYDKLFQLYKSIPFYLQSGIKKLDQNKLIQFETGLIKFGQIDPKSDIVWIVDPKDIKPIANNLADLVGNDAQIIVKTRKCQSDCLDKLIEDANRHKDDPCKTVWTVDLVQWWQVPNRDLVWKAETIKELGNESAFKNEYDMI